MPVPAKAALSVAAIAELYRETQAQRDRLASNLTDPIVVPRDLISPNNTTVRNDIAFQDARSYYITFQFKKYTRRSITQQPFFSEQGKIILPIPRELNDSTKVEYENKELGSVVGMATEGLTSASEGNISQGIGQFLFGALVGAGAATAAGALRAGSQSENRTTRAATSVAERALAPASLAARQLFGATPNPFQVVLFKNPTFKTHRFSWKIIPRDEQESVDLRNLIRTFRYHMLPGVMVGGFLFSFPEIVEVKLFPRDDFTYKFKPCVVTDMTVNYAPNGPSFYRRTDAPTAVDFSISLQEIEIWTKTDFNRVGGV